ncbi:unnamed protein product [Malus baccata var. baccata]
MPEYKSRNGDSRQEAPQVCASVHTWDWQGQGGSNHIPAKHDQQTCRGLDPKRSCCHWRGNLQLLSWEGVGISNCCRGRHQENERHFSATRGSGILISCQAEGSAPAPIPALK